MAGLPALSLGGYAHVCYLQTQIYSVILSAAKDLIAACTSRAVSPGDEILRCAQDDRGAVPAVTALSRQLPSLAAGDLALGRDVALDLGLDGFRGLRAGRGVLGGRVVVARDALRVGLALEVRMDVA